MLTIDAKSSITQKNRTTGEDFVLITSDDIFAKLPEHLHTEKTIESIMALCTMVALKMEQRCPLNGTPPAPLEGAALKKALLTEMLAMGLDNRAAKYFRLNQAFHKYAYEILLYGQKYAGVGPTTLGKIAAFFKSRPVSQVVIDDLMVHLTVLHNNTVDDVVGLNETDKFQELSSVLIDDELQILKKIPLYTLLREHKWGFKFEDIGDKSYQAWNIKKDIRDSIMNYFQMEMVKYINQTL